MKVYPFHLQEEKYWCLSACLQSVLEFRDFQVSQKQISERLQITNKGFNFDLEKLKEFLEEFGLHCGFDNPFLGVFGADLILKNAFPDYDILIAYNSNKLNKNSNSQVKHTALITDYNQKKDLVRLQDPCQIDRFSTTLGDLVKAIPASEDKRYGFYTIG